MAREKRPHTHRYEVIRRIVIAIAVIMALLWTAFLVIAACAAAPDRPGLRQRKRHLSPVCRRYIEILGREGVRVEERMTEGAAENLKPVARSRLACRCCLPAGRRRRIARGRRRGHAGEPVLRAALDFLSGRADAVADQSARRQAHRGRYTGQRHASSGGARMLLANGLVAANGIAPRQYRNRRDRWCRRAQGVEGPARSMLRCSSAVRRRRPSSRRCAIRRSS